MSKVLRLTSSPVSVATVMLKTEWSQGLADDLAKFKYFGMPNVEFHYFLSRLKEYKSQNR